MPPLAPVSTPSALAAEHSPTPGVPLTQSAMRRLNAAPGGWFGTGAAEGYVQRLIEAFEATHPDATADLRHLVNEAKWSTGYRDLGRMVLELL